MNASAFLIRQRRVAAICGAVLMLYGAAGLANYGFARLRNQVDVHWMNAVILAGIFITGTALLRLRPWARWSALGVLGFYFLSGCLHLVLGFWGGPGQAPVTPAWMTGLNIAVGGSGYFFLSRELPGSPHSQWRVFGVAASIALGIFTLLAVSTLSRG